MFQILAIVLITMQSIHAEVFKLEYNLKQFRSANNFLIKKTCTKRLSENYFQNVIAGRLEYSREASNYLYTTTGVFIQTKLQQSLIRL